MSVLNRDLDGKLRDLYSQLREALMNKHIPPELDLNDFTEEELTDEALTSLVHKVQDMKDTLGKILDEVDKGYFDEPS